MDGRGQNFELIPFGSAKRSCPTISFSLQVVVVQLALARLLYGFNRVSPSNASINMAASPGLNNHKATPLEVLIVGLLLCSFERAS
ncbi:hypothetical protein GIB67_007087 [Kingdonia uniflora]|uniref:Cytochrome P450 n=1 Tax=Kingdonia uniflora TaxID=39325 RepID=A0A7J7P067_9MAGN|nr:hypothetical protein GIB67_007087 [Kingdonia uniflora]